MRTTATVPTENGSRYLQQLCKHWSRKMAVEFCPDQGTIHFPTGTVATLVARADPLDVTLDLPESADAERMQRVVAEHLDRFAFREAPLPFEWRAG